MFWCNLPHTLLRGYSEEGALEFTGVLFVNNFTAGYGAGLYADDFVSVRNSRFQENFALEFEFSTYGGAAFVTNSALFSATVFDANEATYGGAVATISADAGFFNCTFQDNEAELGGAAYHATERESDGAPEYLHSTFVGNQAETGSVLFVERGDSAPELRDCIVWNNGATPIDGNADDVSVVGRASMRPAAHWLASRPVSTKTPSTIARPCSTRWAYSIVLTQRIPFAGMSWAFVPYCSGDVHAGNHAATENCPLNFLGHQNVEAVIEALRRNYPTLDRLVFAGASAGGFGTLFNFDLAAGSFGDAEATLLDDSGPVLGDALMTPRESWFGLWEVEPSIPVLCDEVGLGDGRGHQRAGEHARWRVAVGDLPPGRVDRTRALAQSVIGAVGPSR